jgi:hypothetical protein
MKPITAALWPSKRPELSEAPISIDVADENFSKTSTSIFSRRYSPFLAGFRGGFLRIGTYTD